MIKKAALVGPALLAGCAGVALAADLPSRRAPPVYVASPPPAFTWTGFYAGGNVGGGFDDYTNYGLAVGARTPGAAINLRDGTRSPFFATNASGFTGGAQVGYNYQLGGGLLGNSIGALGSGFESVTNGVGSVLGLGPVLGAGGGVIIGIEADADYTDFRTVGIYNGGPAALTSQYLSRTDFIGTVRGRLGYAFGNLLIYGTGGLAYGNVHDNIAIFSTAGGLFGVGGVDHIQTGYTFGGGAEFAIPTSSALNVLKSSAVTLKVEYLHYVLGDDVGMLVNGVNGNQYTVRVLNNGNLVRVGLNYKFDFSPAPAPVVARY